jgi:hypothetical protein
MMSTMFRLFRLCTLCILFTVSIVSTAFASDAPPPPPAPQFRYIRPYWRDANDFKRISEYFTGTETTAGDFIARTTPTARAGISFHVSTSLFTPLPAHSRIRIEYIHSDSPDTQTHTFELPEISAKNPFSELRLGLTGTQWPSKKRRLVAWRLTLLSPENTPLAEQHSFLWSLPKKLENNEQKDKS